MDTILINHNDEKENHFSFFHLQYIILLLFFLTITFYLFLYYSFQNDIQKIKKEYHIEKIRIQNKIEDFQQNQNENIHSIHEKINRIQQEHETNIHSLKEDIIKYSDNSYVLIGYNQKKSPVVTPMFSIFLSIVYGQCSYDKCFGNNIEFKSYSIPLEIVYFEHIQTLRKLKRLGFCIGFDSLRNQIFDFGLLNNHVLEELVFDCNGISEIDFSTIVKISTLKFLSIYRSPNIHHFYQYMEFLPNLQILNFINCPQIVNDTQLRIYCDSKGIIFTVI
jgi:hypothetical protein